VRGYRVKGHEVINADTYREYKANLVLSQFEKDVVKEKAKPTQVFRDKGKLVHEEWVYRGPKAMNRIRQELNLKYNTRVNDQPTFVEKDF
jgi:hypothetical protein